MITQEQYVKGSAGCQVNERIDHLCKGYDIDMGDLEEVHKVRMNVIKWTIEELEDHIRVYDEFEAKVLSNSTGDDLK